MNNDNYGKGNGQYNREPYDGMNNDYYKRDYSNNDYVNKRSRRIDQEFETNDNSTVNSISDNAGVTTASLWYSFALYFNSIIPICISSCQFARLILKNFDRRNDRCHDHQQHTDGKADRQSKLDMGGQQHIPK